MRRRIDNSEQALRVMDKTLRQDMRTINRAEELLLRARIMRERIVQRVRQLLDRDGGRRPSHP